MPRQAGRRANFPSTRPLSLEALEARQLLAALPAVMLPWAPAPATAQDSQATNPAGSASTYQESDSEGGSGKGDTGQRGAGQEHPPSSTLQYTTSSGSADARSRNSTKDGSGLTFGQQFLTQAYPPVGARPGEVVIALPVPLPAARPVPPAETAPGAVAPPEGLHPLASVVSVHDSQVRAEVPSGELDPLETAGNDRTPAAEESRGQGAGGEQDSADRVPRVADVLVGTLPAGLAELQQRVDQFFSTLQQLAGGEEGAAARVRLYEWLLVAAAAGAAFEGTRRVWQRADHRPTPANPDEPFGGLAPFLPRPGHE
jgi:hypothetical protein